MDEETRLEEGSILALPILLSAPRHDDVYVEEVDRPGIHLESTPIGAGSLSLQPLQPQQQPQHIPKDIDVNHLPPPIRESFRLFQSPWKVVRHRYGHYRKVVSGKIDVECPTFELFDPRFDWSGGMEIQMCKRTLTPPNALQSPLRFIVSCHRLSFEVGSLEPVFCRMYLADGATGERLSEDFHFHLNAKSTLHMLPGFEGEPSSHRHDSATYDYHRGSPVPYCPRALFTVLDPPPSLVLVFLFEKVFHGVPDSVIHRVYSGGDKDMELSMIRLKAREVTHTFGEYRQSFCWTSLPLISASSSSSSSSIDSLIHGLFSMKHFYQIPNWDELHPFRVTDFIRNPSETHRRLNGYSGQLLVSITPIHPDVRVSFDLRNEDEFNESLKKHPSMRALIQRGIKSSLNVSDLASSSILEDFEVSPGTPIVSSVSSSNVFSNSSHRTDVTASSDVDDVFPDVETSLYDVDEQVLSSHDPNEQYPSSTGNSRFTESAKHLLFDQILSSNFTNVIAFPQRNPRSPHLIFRHDLFLYLHWARLSQLTSLSSKNILIRVFCRDSDELPPGALQHAEFPSIRNCFYTKHGSPRFSAYAQSKISFNQRNPQFSDEFRLSLPLPVEKKHHLIFVVYGLDTSRNIPMQPDLPVLPATAKLIGFSFMPLFDEKVIQDGLHESLLYSELRSGYLDWGVQSELPLVSNRAAIGWSSRLLSTIYPQDESVARFYAGCAPVFDILSSSKKQNARFLEAALDQAVETMISLQSANFTQLLPYLPVLFNLLFRLLYEIPDLVRESVTQRGSILSSSSVAPGNMYGKSTVGSLHDSTSKLSVSSKVFQYNGVEKRGSLSAVGASVSLGVNENSSMSADTSSLRGLSHRVRSSISSEISRRLSSESSVIRNLESDEVAPSWTTLSPDSSSLSDKFSSSNRTVRHGSMMIRGTGSSTRGHSRRFVSMVPSPSSLIQTSPGSPSTPLLQTLSSSCLFRDVHSPVANRKVVEGVASLQRSSLRTILVLLEGAAREFSLFNSSSSGENSSSDNEAVSPRPRSHVFSDASSFASNVNDHSRSSLSEFPLFRSASFSVRSLPLSSSNWWEKISVVADSLQRPGAEVTGPESNLLDSKPENPVNESSNTSAMTHPLTNSRPPSPSSFISRSRLFLDSRSLELPLSSFSRENRLLSSYIQFLFDDVSDMESSDDMVKLSRRPFHVVLLEQCICMLATDPIFSARPLTKIESQMLHNRIFAADEPPSDMEEARWERKRISDVDTSQFLPSPDDAETRGYKIEGFSSSAPSDSQICSSSPLSPRVHSNSSAESGSSASSDPFITVLDSTSPQTDVSILNRVHDDFANHGLVTSVSDSVASEIMQFSISQSAYESTSGDVPGSDTQLKWDRDMDNELTDADIFEEDDEFENDDVEEMNLSVRFDPLLGHSKSDEISESEGLLSSDTSNKSTSALPSSIFQRLHRSDVAKMYRGEYALLLHRFARSFEDPSSNSFWTSEQVSPEVRDRIVSQASRAWSRRGIQIESELPALRLRSSTQSRVSAPLSSAPSRNEDGDKSLESLERLVLFSWFFMDSIIKSLIFYAQNVLQSVEDRRRIVDFDDHVDGSAEQVDVHDDDDLPVGLPALQEEDLAETRYLLELFVEGVAHEIYSLVQESSIDSSFQAFGTSSSKNSQTAQQESNRMSSSSSQRSSEVAVQLNHSLALFIRDLIGVVESEFIVRLIFLLFDAVGYVPSTGNLRPWYYNVCSAATKSRRRKEIQIHACSVGIRIDFLRVFMDHERSLSLSNVSPALLKTDSETSSTSFLNLFEDTVCEALVHPFPHIRTEACRFLRMLFCKLDLDFDVDQRDARPMIAEVFLPFLNRILDITPIFESLEIDDQQDLAVSCLFLLRNLDVNSRRCWLQKKNYREFCGLIRLCRYITKLFVPPTKPSLIPEHVLCPTSLSRSSSITLEQDSRVFFSVMCGNVVQDIVCDVFDSVSSPSGEDMSFLLPPTKSNLLSNFSESPTTMELLSFVEECAQYIFHSISIPVSELAPPLHSSSSLVLNESGSLQYTECMRKLFGVTIPKFLCQYGTLLSHPVELVIQSSVKKGRKVTRTEQNQKNAWMVISASLLSHLIAAQGSSACGEVTLLLRAIITLGIGLSDDELENWKEIGSSGGDVDLLDCILETCWKNPPLGESINELDIDIVDILTGSDSEENIVFRSKSEVVSSGSATSGSLADSSNEIVAGTVDKLIEYIASPKDQDLQYRKHFFLTYRSFTNPSYLLERLIQRFVYAQCLYEEDVAKSVCIRVFGALKWWIDNHFYDFEPRHIARLIQVADLHMPRSVLGPNPPFQVLRSLLKEIVGYSPIRTTSSALVTEDRIGDTEPILPRQFDMLVSSRSSFNILQWHPLEIARQLTIIEFELFQKIEPRELFGQAWTKDDTKYENAPNIMKMIDRFNSFSGFVCSTILHESRLERRSKIFQRWIEVADLCCSKLNNFNTVHEIIGGLNSASIFRLKKTRHSLPRKHLHTLERLETLMNPAKGMSNLREYIKKVSGSCLPYLGLYFTDLVLLDVGNENLWEGTSLVSFSKCRKIARVISSIESYQLSPFNLRRIPYLQERLSALPPLTRDLENEFFDLSLKIEPRQPKK